MRTRLPTVAAIASVIAMTSIAVVAALTPSEITVMLRDVPSATVVGGQPDVLALDVTIAAPRGDRLDAFAVVQSGTAQWQTDLIDAKLWADAGSAGYQGWYVDRELARGTWNGAISGWAFGGIDEPVLAAGSRFFVTVSTATNPTNNATIALRIPEYRDSARAMQYDAGDLGVFLRTARPAPAAPIANVGSLSLERRPVDADAPEVRITEPAAGASRAVDWLLIQGVARDLGGSAVARVRVGVNRVGHAITWVDAVPETAGFGSWEVRLFGLRSPETYEIRVTAEDWIGNRSAATDPVRVALTE